jgi:hypothetical protein
MLSDGINKKYIAEEMAKEVVCECCEFRESTLLYLVKSGLCTVLSHICIECKRSCKEDCIVNDYEFQFIIKPLHK